MSGIWDNRLLDQLPYAMQCKFPAALTYKYAVDKSLLTLLRSRTLGNSPSAIQASISELYSENWIQRGTMHMQGSWQVHGSLHPGRPVKNWHVERQCDISFREDFED